MTALEEAEEVQRMVMPSGGVQPLREKINTHCLWPAFDRLVAAEGAIVGVDTVAEAAEAVLEPVEHGCVPVWTAT